MDISKLYTASAVQADEGSYGPIPAGWYDVSVERAEVRNTKAGTGTYLSVMFRVTGPSHANAVVWGTYTLSNPNEKAVEIGHSQLKSLHTACGIPTLTDTDQLVGCTCAISVKVKQDLEYGDKNEVKGHRSPSGGAAAPKAGPLRSAPPSRPPSGPPPRQATPSAPADEEIPF